MLRCTKGSALLLEGAATYKNTEELSTSIRKTATRKTYVDFTEPLTRE